MPYRTMDNFISGAVLTFTKITPIKAMTAQIRGLKMYTQKLIDAFTDATIVIDGKKRILVCNNPFVELFRLKNSETTEQSFLEIVSNQWHMDVLAAKLSKKLPSEDRFHIQHHFNGIGVLDLDVSMERIGAERGEQELWVIKFQKK